MQLPLQSLRHINVIVFNENHIEQSKPMIFATSDLYRPLFLQHERAELFSWYQEFSL